MAKLMNKVEKIANEDIDLINGNDTLIEIAPESYLPQSEIDRVKQKVGFNGLTPTEWASLSKNVWNDVSSPRNKYQLEHGAVYPVKLV